MRALTQQGDFPRARSLAITFDELRAIQAVAKAGQVANANGGAGSGLGVGSTAAAASGRNGASLGAKTPGAKAVAAKSVNIRQAEEVLEERDTESEELVQQWHRDHDSTKPALMVGIAAAKRALRRALRRNGGSSPMPAEARV